MSLRFLGKLSQMSLVSGINLPGLLLIGSSAQVKDPQMILRSPFPLALRLLVLIQSLRSSWSLSPLLGGISGGKKALELSDPVFEKNQVTFKEIPLFAITEHQAKLSLGNYSSYVPSVFRDTGLFDLDY